MTSTATLTSTPSLTCTLTLIRRNLLGLWSRTSRPDIAKHYTIARGSAMECAAILDVMKIQQTIKPQRYDRGVTLLTSVVAMLTKMI